MKQEIIDEAIKRYCLRHNLKEWEPAAALIDMDGVLYDSMPRHAAAWQRMMSEQGIETELNEFFLYEGMTGKATINLLFEKHLNRRASAAEVEALYAKKSEYFKSYGARIPMNGAAEMLEKLRGRGVMRVLVTGSAQKSLLESLAEDFPLAFDENLRVTALDVAHGKPDPEPYLIGQKKAGQPPHRCIVIENAPLGIQAGHASGSFTIAVATGPIPAETLKNSGADIVFASMPEFAKHIDGLLQGKKL